jgi:hypothetical protein
VYRIEFSDFSASLGCVGFPHVLLTSSLFTICYISILRSVALSLCFAAEISGQLPDNSVLLFMFSDLSYLFACSASIYVFLTITLLWFLFSWLLHLGFLCCFVFYFLFLCFLFSWLLHLGSLYCCFLFFIPLFFISLIITFRLLFLFFYKYFISSLYFPITLGPFVFFFTFVGLYHFYS